MSAAPQAFLVATDASACAAQQLDIGQQYYAQGRIGEAIAAYRQGLAAAESEAPGAASVGPVPMLHAKLGDALLVQGDLESAAASYKAALRLAPGLTSCWCNLGNVQLKAGKPQDAVALYLHALKLDSGHWASRTNLVQALMATKQYIIARALLQELVDERPLDGKLHHELGKACFELNDAEAAIGHFERALAVNPGDSESLYWIGGIRQRSGDIAAAEAAYAQAAQIQPLIRRPAARSPASFCVLALYAPFGGNTPTEFLFKDAVYETDTLALFASSIPDIESLKKDRQVVVNLISDADQAAEMLPLAADLVSRLDRPTINDPRKIMRTTRDAVAEVLREIPGCRVPRAVRLAAGADRSAAALQAALPFSFPALARPAGTHGGDDFEKTCDIDALAAFLAQRPDSDHYLIEYIDYRSADGHFRKYRFIFVGDEILPYHLAIGNDWKVHHVHTDMAHQPWMQREEAAYLDAPTAVFSPEHYRMLRTIRQRIGLEYFGIDCGLDANGDLVVFEVNASMLVHERNEEFPYKDPHVRRIKQAFDAMLEQLAVGAV
jgi:tetratricopeptide (TPR) repeat protein